MALPLEQVKDADRNLWTLLATGAVQGIRASGADRGRTIGRNSQRRLVESVDGDAAPASTQDRERQAEAQKR